MAFDPVSYAMGQKAGGGGSVRLQDKTGLSITQNGQFSFTPDAGYDGLSAVSGTVAVQPSPTKAAQTYTPTTTDQVIAANQWLAGAQTIKGDANLIAGNIKDGVSIFGVAGSYSGGSGVTVETINGTLSNPWGNRFAEIKAGILDGSITAYAENQTDPVASTLGKMYVRAIADYAIVIDGTSDGGMEEIPITNPSYYAADSYFYDYSDGSFLQSARCLFGSVTLSASLINIPCTLTIIHHPLPT